MSDIRDGFKKFDRLPLKKRPIRERVQDNKEVYAFYTYEEFKQQASRCMDCGTPFCHSACPVGSDMSHWILLAENEDYEKAYHVLTQTNNFPEFTSRLCLAPCESACVLGINKPPVSIQALEFHVIEIAFSKDYVKPVKAPPPTGKRVAIIGSGPAGLACADNLSKVGMDVTVFERDDRPGGFLRYGIPDYRLEKWVIDRRIKIMEDAGIKFLYNVEVGKDVDSSEIVRGFDAVVLCIGATIPRNLPIPGRDLKGIYFAVDVLKDINKRIAGIESQTLPNINLTGKDVVVISGNVNGWYGIFSRAGVKSIKVFDVMVQPPQSRTAHMPWPTYPMILKNQMETMSEYGGEQWWGVNTLEFLGDENGNLRAVKVSDVNWELDVLGRPVKFVSVENTEREITAQVVILSMGMLNPQYSGLCEQLGLEFDERKNIKAREGVYRTNVSKVFVAGDARRGQSQIVWAISEGRETARKVEEFLMGESTLMSKDSVNPFI